MCPDVKDNDLMLENDITHDKRKHFQFVIEKCNNDR